MMTANMHFIDKVNDYDIRAVLIDGRAYFASEDVAKILGVTPNIPPEEKGTIYASMDTVFKVAFLREADEFAEWLSTSVVPRLYGAVEDK